MSTRRAILAGGSGFLGQSLADELLSGGYEVVVLTRVPDRLSANQRMIEWDGRTLSDWAELIDGAEAVVNLTGKSVNCRYTDENRREIVDSRVDSVKVLGAAIAACARPPKVFVQTGSLAIYGDAGSKICDESTAPGLGFSAETCVRWEEAFNGLELPTTRRVLLRIGFALGPTGGALAPLSKLARFFLGGTVGSGLQYISWLHIHDLNQMFIWAIERSDIEGVFNSTGPNPVTNAAFMRAMRRELGRPWSPPTPVWAVHIGAALMGTEPELALTGRRCVPAGFLKKGFSFKYADLGAALRNALH